ncbi:hypothetical protein [Wenzhouxiangella sp. EGI_FJ10305]|uniref:hypothetical protein n=1 Tax=Wenzhouxiangella sp. EGI_FJ10305 TaxID=3243768 RepID=UPI0035DE28EB
MRMMQLAGVAGVAAASAMAGALTATSLVLGDGTEPVLRVLGLEPFVDDPPLLVSTTAAEGVDNSAFYTLMPEGKSLDAGALGASTRMEGGGRGVGATLYAENDGDSGTVWGLNSMGVTWTGQPAVGAEINGFNYSDDFALVRGMEIVNGGSAPTELGLSIMTSNAQPAGKPQYGIVLGGPEFGYSEHAPASRAGIVVDSIDSGEALRIAAGNFISLDGAAGRIRLRYNPEEDRIEFFNGDRLAHSIPMD